MVCIILNTTKFEDIPRQWSLFPMKYTYTHPKRLKKMNRALMTYEITSPSPLYCCWSPRRKVVVGPKNIFKTYGLKIFKSENKSINLKNYEVP